MYYILYYIYRTRHIECLVRFFVNKQSHGDIEKMDACKQFSLCHYDAQRDRVNVIHEVLIHENVLYSHADPDHTMGMRVFEQLRMDWLGCSVGKKNNNPIEVAALPTVIEELRGQKTFRGSVLDYYEWRGFVSVNASYFVEKGDIRIALIPVDKKEEVAIFVIAQGDKKVIYAPCVVKPFPENEFFNDADVLIIGNTIVGDVLKGGFVEMKLGDVVCGLQERYAR